VSQSLAGRTAVLSLLPFSLPELRKYRKKWEPFELIVNGTYLRLYEEKLKPGRFFKGRWFQLKSNRRQHSLRIS
jgi:hypothetical protein